MAEVKKVLVLMAFGGMFEEKERELLRQSVPGATFDFCRGIQGIPLEEYDAIVGNPPAERLGECRAVKLIQLISAGTGNYPEAVQRMGRPVALANATGAYGPAIAEHMMGMLLLLMKRLGTYHDHMRDGLWRDEGRVASLQGAQVLIVGMGDIGGCFGRLCQSFGAHVTGIRRPLGPVPDYAEAVYLQSDLDRLLPQSDVVALSLPETDATRGLFSRERLMGMKQGAYLLNVGRGSAINTEALCDVLEHGRLGGAGLDVTDPEPLPPDHCLWRMPNALITPHISGGDHVYTTVERIAAIAADNLRRLAGDEALGNLVDLETGYRRTER